MSKVSEMTRDKWIMSTFPEWGTWLVEDIENEVVQPGNVAMWWLGCTGIWMKTPGGANVTIDLWCGNGKRTHGNGKMAVGHQMANMCGGRAISPICAMYPLFLIPLPSSRSTPCWPPTTIRTICPPSGLPMCCRAA